MDINHIMITILDKKPVNNMRLLEINVSQLFRQTMYNCNGDLVPQHLDIYNLMTTSAEEN